jgi:transcriptional regulator with XRE-family HTH domain
VRAVDALEDVSATLAARRLGLMLRALRVRMNTLRVADVAKAAGVSQPTWSQIETAVAIPTRKHLVGAMKILEADEATTDTLLALRERAKRPEWWHDYGDVASQTTLKMIGYEASAVRLRQCASGWIPGLLQTAEWARASMLVPGATIRPENVDRAVELRIRRQDELERETFQLHAICGEEALRYRVGGREVHQAQLRYLRSVLESNERVTLQVTPFSGSLHVGHSRPYTIVDFAHDLDTTIVQLEQAAMTFTDVLPEVRLWAYVFENLTRTALSPDETMKLIEAILKEVS